MRRELLEMNPVKKRFQLDSFHGDVNNCNNSLGNFTPNDMDLAFVVGTPRSGSTLLSSILSRHSTVAVPPETSFFLRTFDRRFLFYLFNWYSINFRAAMVDYLFTNSRFLDLGLSKSAVLEEFGKYPVGYKFLFRSFLQVFAVTQGKNRVIEKTPTHLEYVDIIMKWYPDSKIVHILRDGRDVSLSLMQVPWTHKSLERHAAYWAWCARKSRKLEHKYPENFYTIKFEELIAAPEQAIRKVCAFLGVDFEMSMLDADVKVATVPEWEGAWKDASLLKPTTSKMARWKTEDINIITNIQQIISAELREYDYPLADIQHVKVGVMGWLKIILWHRHVFNVLYTFQKIRRFILPKYFYFRERQLSGKISK